LFSAESTAAVRDPQRPAQEARPRPLHAGRAYARYVLSPDARLRLPDVAANCPLELTVEDAAGAVLQRREVPGAPAGEAALVQFSVSDVLQSLAVTVRDEEGEMLVGAVVQLVAPGTRAVFRRTGLGGRTVFVGLSAATTHVDVELTKRGFVSSLRRGVALESALGSEPGARLELVLANGIDTVFTVLDEVGLPVTDADVRVAVGTELVRAAAHTGDGRYIIQDLPRAVMELVIRRGEQELRESVEPSADGAALVVHLPSVVAARGK
jgi:hypothetical protein